jgi:hypothetical protein
VIVLVSAPCACLDGSAVVLAIRKRYMRSYAGNVPVLSATQETRTLSCEVQCPEHKVSLLATHEKKRVKRTSMNVVLEGNFTLLTPFVAPGTFMKKS